MTNNDILRQLRFVFDFKDHAMVKLFAMGGLEVTHGQLILVNIIPFHYAMRLCPMTGRCLQRHTHTPRERPAYCSGDNG